MNTNKPKSVAFAYFSNDKFLGWYGGTFGSCAKSPKLYNDTEDQKEVVRKNFQHKLKSINETSLEQEKNKDLTLYETISLLRFDSEDELRGRNVELRSVETPFYDGPSDEYQKYLDSDKPDGYKLTGDTWVYADYTKVREWATNEPTEFKETLSTYKL